jgi:MerR HTH family regulatory protein
MTVTAGPPLAAPPDPLATLREYRTLAPWGLRDLAALAAGVLDASGVVPVNAAARARPSERTIRFYVARGLVSPPDGRGTAAVYSYRHLLQVLAIKLRQMEGATLETMTREFSDLTGDLIERRVAGVLGPALPRPDRLALLQAPGTGRGRVGRAVLGWLAPVGGPTGEATACRRIPVAPGVEVLIDEQHPVLRLNGDMAVIAESLRRALAGLVAS